MLPSFHHRIIINYHRPEFIPSFVINAIEGITEVLVSAEKHVIKTPNRVLFSQPLMMKQKSKHDPGCWNVLISETAYQLPLSRSRWLLVSLTRPPSPTTLRRFEVIPMIPNHHLHYRSRRNMRAFVTWRRQVLVSNLPGLVIHSISGFRPLFCVPTTFHCSFQVFIPDYLPKPSPSSVRTCCSTLYPIVPTERT